MFFTPALVEDATDWMSHLGLCQESLLKLCEMICGSGLGPEQGENVIMSIRLMCSGFHAEVSY